MQGPDEVIVQDARGDGVLRFGAMRVHNLHLQGGVAKAKTCALCARGLESILAKGEGIPAPATKVAEGDGGDQEDDTASSSGDWADPERLEY